jgi:PadR family transcriptional regulator PadR
MAGIRMTYATARVLQALDQGLRYGFDIAAATGLRGGTVYPILRRLEEEGLVSSTWEPVEIGRKEGRPTRKYYRLLVDSAELVEEARSRFPFPLRAGSEWQADGA